MLPATFSIKGSAALTFKESKQNMKAPSIWETITKIQQYYPEKFKLSVTSVRGGHDQTEIEDPLLLSSMMDMTKGCIETCDIRESSGASVNLLLGACYEYKIPFGVHSDDIGHRSIILTLPFPMVGCYILSTRFEGSIKKSLGVKEHYMLDMNLDIHIGELTQEGYMSSLAAGMKVYPFKLNHPSYFPKADSSESEFTSEPSDSDEADGAASIKRSRKVRMVRPKGITKRQKQKVISHVGAKISDAVARVTRQRTVKEVKEGSGEGTSVHGGSENGDATGEV